MAGNRNGVVPLARRSCVIRLALDGTKPGKRGAAGSAQQGDDATLHPTDRL
jgi:hypothetical protein